MKKIIFGFFTFALIALVSCGGNKENAAEKDAEMLTAEEGVDVVTDNITDNSQFKIVDNILYSENLPIVVDFYADWCNPCKAYSPTFHEVAGKFANTAVFVSINVDEYPDIAAAYNVTSIPTTAFILTGGATMGTEEGILSADRLETLINQLIATNAGANMEL